MCRFFFAVKASHAGINIVRYNIIVMHLSPICKEHYVNNCGITGINILNASGKDAEQSVFHLHFHILPRFENDGHKIWPELSGSGLKMEDVLQKFKML